MCNSEFYSYRMCFTLTDMELKANPDGWVGRFFPKKQRGEAVEKTFLVPRNVGQGALDVFSVVNQYMILTAEQVGDLNGESPLFLCTNTVGDRFVLKKMGYNSLRYVPRVAATRLKLPDPHLFTGHCLRRFVIIFTYILDLVLTLYFNRLHVLAGLSF